MPAKKIGILRPWAFGALVALIFTTMFGCFLLVIAEPGSGVAHIRHQWYLKLRGLIMNIWMLMCWLFACCNSIVLPTFRRLMTILEQTTPPISTALREAPGWIIFLCQRARKMPTDLKRRYTNLSDSLTTNEYFQLLYWLASLGIHITKMRVIDPMLSYLVFFLEWGSTTDISGGNIGWIFSCGGFMCILVWSLSRRLGTKNVLCCAAVVLVLLGQWRSGY